MKIAFYDPYLDTMGGGERYFIQAAVYFKKKSHDVSFFWNPSQKDEINNVAKTRFNLDIAGLNFINDIFSTKVSLLTRYQSTKQFDVIFYLSDGSIPFLFARKNILMFQHPIDWVKLKAVDLLKLRFINNIICNSKFVKAHIDNKLGAEKTVVIYPAIDDLKYNMPEKEKIILSVGRFTANMNAKKQDVLLEAFKKINLLHKDWKLILTGGMREEDRVLVNSLKRQAEGMPVKILENIDYKTLVDLYNKASIYWHATGFGEDVIRHPEKTEHFGISVVEAMSTGCVPVVFAAGGLPEIVEDGKYGLTWKTVDELIERTEDLIKDSKLYDDLAKKSQVRAADFSQQVLFESLNKILFS